MKFVGPIAPNIVAVITPKSSNLVINSIEDLNQLSIGVVRDDIGEQLLISQGVKPEAIDQLNSGLSMVKKLASGRIDALGYAHATTQLLFKTAHINPDDFEIIHVLKSSTMGYAFHSSTGEQILEPMRKALKELDVDGTLANIQIKYGLKEANE
jgi:polar amino acid transport system substrate-binding protein